MLTLRKIPNSKASKPPSVCELLRTDVDLIVHRAVDGTPDLWAGRCSVTMDSPSELDPLYKMAPRRMLGGFYGIYDWTLPQGRQVKNYLAAADEEAPVSTGSYIQREELGLTNRPI